MIPIFDGHNDTLTHLLNPKESFGRSFFERSDIGHIDLPRAREAGMWGGFFAIWTHPPDDSPERNPWYGFRKTPDGYEVAMRSPLEQGRAEKITDSVIEFAYRLEQESVGQVKIVREYDGLEHCLDNNAMAMALHIEGAVAIKEDLSNLEKFYRAGIRSIGIVWSRPNDFGEGVPYRYPHSPDTGPGLTEPGKALVRKCNDLGIMVDLAHMNEKGFWDAAEITEYPLVVSHSAAHKLCPSTRNLTDEQIDAVGQTGGLIGIWYEPVNLRGDGEMDRHLTFDTIVRHIAYIADRIGVDHVAFGSDFDGATMSDTMKDVSCYPALLETMRNAGFETNDLEKIAYKNWLRVIKETWK